MVVKIKPFARHNRNCQQEDYAFTAQKKNPLGDQYFVAIMSNWGSSMSTRNKYKTAKKTICITENNGYDNYMHTSQRFSNYTSAS